MSDAIVIIAWLAFWPVTLTVVILLTEWEFRKWRKEDRERTAQEREWEQRLKENEKYRRERREEDGKKICHYCNELCHPRQGAAMKLCSVDRTGYVGNGYMVPACRNCIYDYDLSEELEEDWVDISSKKRHDAVAA